MGIEARTLGEFEQKHRLILVEKLMRASDNLAHYFPEGTLWHAGKLDFEIPAITVRGHEVSTELHQMGLGTTDLHVIQHTSPGEYDGDDYLEGHRVWQVGPPKSDCFIGRYVSERFGTRSFPGIGMNLYVPTNPDEVSAANLGKLVEDGVINLDLLFWFDQQDFKGYYNRSKPEAVLLEMVRRDPIASLEFSLWMLESLKTVREINPDKQSFEL